MITAEDIQAAIAECEGTRRPNANTCLKLAALYTIREQMQPKNGETEKPQETMAGYSFAKSSAQPTQNAYYTSETEFGHIVSDKDVNDVYEVFDELLNMLQGMIPRLYDGIIVKLQNL